MPTEPVPAVTISESPTAAGNTIVRGPGQNTFIKMVPLSDQEQNRFTLGAALDLPQFGERLFVEGVNRKPVETFRRQGKQSALSQQATHSISQGRSGGGIIVIDRCHGRNHQSHSV